MNAVGPGRPVTLTPPCTASPREGEGCGGCLCSCGRPRQLLAGGPQATLGPASLSYHVLLIPGSSSKHLLLPAAEGIGFHLVGLSFAGCVHLHPGAQRLCRPRQRPPEIPAQVYLRRSARSPGLEGAGMLGMRKATLSSSDSKGETYMTWKMLQFAFLKVPIFVLYLSGVPGDWGCGWQSWTMEIK